VLTAVALRFMPDDPPLPDAENVTLRTILRSLWRDIVRVRHDRRLLLFLLAYATFMDAILTVEGNVTLYMERIMRLGSSVQAYLLLLLLVMSAVGARLSAPFATRYGLKTAFTVVLVGWIVILAGLSMAADVVFFSVLFGLAGVAYGAISNCARVTYLLLIPSHRRAEYLGLYASFERCASFTGPLAWGATVSLLGVGTGYRAALLLMAGLVAVSLPLIRAIDLDTPERAAEPSLA
jgi:UMF1 family MFS transporter